jgi:hypothetical protein
MFLKVTQQKNGRKYLAITKGFRKNGKMVQKSVKGLGFLDELEKQFPDPIAHFKAEALRLTAEEKEHTQARQITIHPSEKISLKGTERKNIGCTVALLHYNASGIECVLRNASRNRHFEYDLNAIMRLLVTERILNPGSKLKAFENRDNYFFKCDFSDDDIYRALDLFCEVKDNLIAAINRFIEGSGRREMTNVYYDVTNYFFEIDEEDELRKKGVSKEHRKDPIVQMGLLQDGGALPITYRLFPGNTNDCNTMLPVLKDLKRDYGLKRVIVVADKGLNCSDNIAANILDGNGFVFSQSIRATKSTSAFRDWVTAESGYKESPDGSFKSKSRQDYKTIHVRGDDAKMHEEDVEVKVVAFWSRKHFERSRHKRAEVLAKAQELVKSPSSYTRATHYGAARYVKNITFDKKTGEVMEDTGRHAELDTKAITEAEKCDGYYCIITSETEVSDEGIIDIYKGLWRIEEAFKITKSEIEARPVFVWTPKHLEAHFLTCYIALVIIRLIQSDMGYGCSAGAIIDELKAMSGSRYEDNWWLFNHRTELSDMLCASVGIDLTRKYLQLGDIKKILAAVNKKG